MKKRLTLIACLLLLLIAKSQSQVNLQTGSATFSLPIFNWQDNKSRLSSVVSLDYSSGNGLKVNDVASSAGQGWNLLAGGVITRLQVGEPDDQILKDGAVEDVTKYPAGYLYDTASAKKGCPSALTRYPLFSDKNHVYKQHNQVAADRELDYFSFQFGGKTGMFVLGKDNGNSCFLLGKAQLKVWYDKDESMVSQGIRTTITAFYIQDETGAIYKFRQHGLAKLLKTSYCDGDLIQSLTQPDFKGGNVYHDGAFDDGSLVNPYVITSWYLSEVEDPLTHRKISFGYTVRNIDHTAGTDFSYYKENDYSIISHHRSVAQAPAITTINYPDGHSVQFNYGNPRADLTGDYALASIDVLYQGRYLSEHQLTTSYFILNRFGSPITPYQKTVARLCLLQVKKIGVDLKADNPPYIFDYYTGSDSPDDIVAPAFSHLKDAWGYYNGDNSKSYDGSVVPITSSLSSLNANQVKGLCFFANNTSALLQSAKAGYAKNGLLKQIVYPTGGSINYIYDQNTGVISGQTVTVGGVHVSSTLVADGGYSNGCDNPIATKYNYILDANAGGGSSLWGLEMPVNTLVTQNHYAPERRQYHWTFPCCGRCDYKYQYPGILSHEDKISLTDHQKFLVALSKFLNVVSSALTTRDIVVLFLPGGNNPISWAAVVIDLISSLVDLFTSCFSDFSKDVTNTVYYNADLNGSNPLPVQFKRVEIVQGSGSNGKTVEEFTSDTDIPVWEQVNPAYSMKQRYAYWAYGLPKLTTVYDASGNLVKRVENTYDTSQIKLRFVKNAKLGIYYIDESCKCLVKKSSSQRSTDWSNVNYFNDPGSFVTGSTDDMTVEIYHVYTGWVNLRSTTERTYRTSDPSKYLESTTYYEYNSRNYNVNYVQTTGSDGSWSYKYIKYVDDYIGVYGNDSSGVLGTLFKNNIWAVPVAVSTQVNRSDANGNTTGGFTHETVTEFMVTGNGDIKPMRTMEQRFNQPTRAWAGNGDPDPNAYRPYHGPGNTDNATSYKITQRFSYDATGNLAGMLDEGSHSLTNIYDYDDHYIVATVMNADPVLDGSCYTSFETSSMGGWKLNTPANYSGNAITGNRSLTLDGSTLSSLPLNNQKGYRLSFWTTGSVSISGGSATLVSSAPVINGFTYYEYTLSQGASQVTLSGNGQIDELKIYPVNARMRTTTYDPLIGRTSECDENGRIAYYDYDELGRLQFVKDENSHIVKSYEYNTVSNGLNGCPGTYKNRPGSELFTKNDCGTGYIGTDVMYSVPAAKYSSTISQADADRQMEADLMANGQAYANANGSCKQVFTNDAQSQGFVTQSCQPGSAGGTVTYSVPAGKYSSLISKDDANQKAIIEINANGQAYANAPAHAVCSVSSVANWVSVEPFQYKCETDANGKQTGHQVNLQVDENPNSPTYNQTRWVDMGIDNNACPENNAPCLQYRIKVPHSVENNLFIEFTPCDTGVLTVKGLTELMLDQSEAGYSITTICSKTQLSFRYGRTGPNQQIPGIIVEKQGACQ